MRKSLSQKTLEWVYNTFKDDTSKMLIATGTLGWALSSLAQMCAIVWNPKISSDKKSFLLPQELMDAVVNIGSFHCQVTMNGVPRSGYSTAKGAVLMMSKALAAEWAKSGVTVNVLGPGYFASEMSAKVANEAYENGIKNGVPMGRRGTPGELNGAMLFLASDASSYVTGQLVLVDGGWTIV